MGLNSHQLSELAGSLSWDIGSLESPDEGQEVDENLCRLARHHLTTARALLLELHSIVQGRELESEELEYGA